MRKQWVILGLLYFALVCRSNALVLVHKMHALSPKSNVSVNVMANGARYRFYVNIGVVKVEGGYVFATDGYKYEQGSILWEVKIPDGGDVGVTLNEGEESGNNQLKSLQWQTPILNKTYEVKVSGKRWPYGEGGGGGTYDPNWASTSTGQITNPVIYSTAIIKDGEKYTQGQELAVNPGDTVTVEAKAGEGSGTPITNSAVTVFWALKDPNPANQGTGTLSAAQSTTDNTGLATVTLTCSSKRGDDHIVTAQDKSSSPASSCDSGKALLVGVTIDAETVQDPNITDEIQVQRVKLSTFAWEAIPFKIVYDIVPVSGWTPDKVTLYISEGGTTVYTKELSKTSGNNQVYEWNGENDEGDLVPYGAYKAQIKVKKSERIFESAEYAFTVYQINQGNTVYYDLDVPLLDNEHAGVIYSYIGGNTLTDLHNKNKYLICEVQGAGQTVNCSRTLTEFMAFSTFRGVWTSAYFPGGVFDERRERAQIINNCYRMFGIPYVKYTEFANVLIVNGSWDGTISDILRTRCDGVPEVAYENAGDRLFGEVAYWNIMLSQSNLDYHNHQCTPRLQRCYQIPFEVYSP